MLSLQMTRYLWIIFFHTENKTRKKEKKNKPTLSVSPSAWIELYLSFQTKMSSAQKKNINNKKNEKLRYVDPAFPWF